MRSRTELVTTTFVDSEEEFSEDDDSEEDWRPSASNKNGKKRRLSADNKRGRKRKMGSNSVGGLPKAKRRVNYKDSDEDEDTDLSDEDYEDYDYLGSSHMAQKKNAINLPPKKQFTEKSGDGIVATGSGQCSANRSNSVNTLDLLLNKRDLNDDYKQNNRLCLWRKDDNNLLQKYIRVKTAPEEFLFTSSSVYSSWDDQRISDFVTIKVKCLDPNNRRVMLADPNAIKNLMKDLANENHDNESQENEDGADDAGDDDDEDDADDDDEDDDDDDENYEKTAKTADVARNPDENDNDEELGNETEEIINDPDNIDDIEEEEMEDECDGAEPDDVNDGDAELDNEEDQENTASD